MTPHAVPDEALLARLPLPLAQLYRRAHNAKTALERHLTTFYLWEAALKLLASAAVVEYAGQGTPNPQLAERLQNLARPSLGHWWEFARRLVPVLADEDAGFRNVRDLLLGKPRNDLPRTAGLDAALREALDGSRGNRALVSVGELFDRLVRLRNEEVGHGAAGLRSADYYERMGATLLAGLGELLGKLDVLAGRKLLYIADVRRVASGAWLVERYELSGESARRLESQEVPEAEAAWLPRPGRLYLAAGNDAGHLLHPLVLYDAETTSVSFFNCRRGERRAEYLCYITGKVDKRDELGQDRRELLARVLNAPVDSAKLAELEALGTTEEPPAPALSVGRRTLGEFELISQLGRGGMGVVYRAWQSSLGRQVALKCLLRSGDPKAEARFAREIHALGKVEHPNLVKVFTSGTDGDQWFYAMELVEGADLGAVIDQLAGSTAADLADDSWTTALSSAAQQQRQKEEALGGADDAPISPAPTPRPKSPHPHRSAGHVAQVVEVVRQVAEAANTLHEAGVVHRDIKPANILLTDDGGHAVLMDLGLAQLTDETEGRLTRTRQFLGTLRYSSPEQVLAAAKLDRRADVYSLGATLWELLTLRPLFGATEQTPTPELMLTIQLKDPERPRRLNRRVPPDLQAIVMRCLEKDRSRRYATAAELAEDLARWQRGEPVQAQPPSLGYLLRKKLRRHWAPLTLAVGVLLAAVVGMAVSFWQISDALEKEKAANVKLQTSQDNLEGTLARSWLVPLAMQPGPLSDQEVEVLPDIAAKRKDHVTIRFVEEALKEARFTRRFRVRAEYALHASVGLDPERRKEVERQLARYLESTEFTDEVRIDVALAATKLGELSPAFAAFVAQTLVGTFGKTNDRDELRSLVEGLSAVAARLEPQAAAAAAALIARTMAGVQNPYRLAALAEGQAAVAARLEPQDAARMAKDTIDRLAIAMAEYKAKDNDKTGALAVALSAMTADLEPMDAAIILTKAMAEAKGASTLEPLAARLATAARRVEAKDAAVLIAKVMTEAKDAYPLRDLASSLALVAPRLEPTDAGYAAAIIAKAMAESESKDKAAALAAGLAALAARLGPKDAGAAATAIVTALVEAYYIDQVRDLTAALVAVAPRLSPEDAAGAAALLTKATAKASFPDETMGRAQGLAAVAARLESEAAGRAAGKAACHIVKGMTEPENHDGQRERAIALAALAAYLDSKDAACAATLLTKAMTKVEHAGHLRALAEGLAAVAARMKPEDAARAAAEAAALLIKVMTAPKAFYGLQALGYGVAAVAARMKPEDAARAAAEAAALLTKAMVGVHPSDQKGLGECLAMLAARMRPDDAARATAEAATIFGKAMIDAGDSYLLRSLTVGLVAVIARMEPADAERAAWAAAAVLVKAMADSNNRVSRGDLAEALASVAARMDPKDAGRLAAVTSFARGVNERGIELVNDKPRMPDYPIFGCLEKADLVDLLKQPLCVGATRRLVLDELGKRYQRCFVDQWDFVRFAREEKLGFDLAGPPKYGQSSELTAK